MLMCSFNLDPFPRGITRCGSMIINHGPDLLEEEEEEEEEGGDEVGRTMSRARSTDLLSDVMSESEEEEMRARIQTGPPLS